MSVTIRFADRAAKSKQPIIRVIDFLQKEDPEFLAFGEGNPSIEACPIDTIREISERLLAEEPKYMFSYTATLGDPQFRELIKKRMVEKKGMDPENNEILVMTGGQQGLMVVPQMFTNEGDAVITEEITYQGMLDTIRNFGGHTVGVRQEEDGIDVKALEEAIRSTDRISFIYLIPNFSNPTGITTSLEKRKAVYELACRYDKIILEDDPYTELRFAGESVDPVKSLDTEGRVFYTSSLSKVICPSFRLGYLVADKRFRQYLNVCKQVTDIHSNTLAQYVAWGIMTKTDYEEHLNRAREEYRKRVALVTETLKKNMHPSCRISAPEGGLFMMLFMPDCVDAVEFTWKGIERGVVCVPGSGFLIDGNAPSHSIRMCYSTAPIEDVARGAEIIGKLTWDMIEGKD